MLEYLSVVGDMKEDQMTKDAMVTTVTREQHKLEGSELETDPMQSLNEAS